MSVRTFRLNANWPELTVIFEDAHLMAVDKPAGLLVAPDRWDKTRDNLMDLLHDGIRTGKAWARDAGIGYLANAHRLDVDTSGVLLLARTREVLISLVNQFSRRETQKIYLALMDGGPEKDTVDIDLPIGPHPIRPGLSVIDRAHGKQAISKVRVIERFGRHTLAEVEILTGRHHQVRVHLNAMGSPLVGDRLYGGKPLLLSELKPRYKMKADGEKPLIGRPALHAWRLNLKHPVTGEDLKLEAPLPKDLTVGLKYLRQYGRGRSAPKEAVDPSWPSA
jgi:23S rRNA pseudouridine1911/1915/1917 synthase